MSHLYLRKADDYKGNPSFEIVFSERRGPALKINRRYLVYTLPVPIDGHWLVRVSRNSLSSSESDEVIGVTSHQDRIPQKTLEYARTFSQALAVTHGLDLIVELEEPEKD